MSEKKIKKVIAIFIGWLCVKLKISVMVNVRIFKTMNKIKYIIHPGNIYSKNDGDFHYISGERLIKLYNLNPKECLIVRYPRPFSRMPFGMSDDPSYKHLYPRYDGNYSI